MFYRNSSTKSANPSQKPTVIKRQTDLKIKSSIPYWDQKNAAVSFSENVKKHDYVNLFWYYLTDDGKIATYTYADEDKNIISLAHNNDVKVLATITNLPETGTWDTDRVESMLKSDDSREAHIKDLVKKVHDLGFDGVNIDYEEVDASEKNRFTLLIKELADALHTDGKLLSISLHPKRAGNEGLGAFQDWKKLSDDADQLTIMAFNEHYDEGSAGPIASIPWLEKVIAYAQSLSVPEDQIYLGIPLFGYDWNHDNDEAAAGLTYADVRSRINTYNVGEAWNNEFKSPYFNYDNEGDDHEVWYENARSVKEKINLAERTGLAGVSFWRLGGEDPEIWKAL